LPAKARLVSSNVSPSAQTGDTLLFELRLDVDQQLDVIFDP
jgi:hypothetical protein